MASTTVRTRSMPQLGQSNSPLPEKDVADLRSLISAIKEAKKNKMQQAGESSESSSASPSSPVKSSAKPPASRSPEDQLDESTADETPDTRSEGVQKSEGQHLESDDDLEKYKVDEKTLLKVTILSSVEETCFYLPVCLLVDREVEMRKAAKQFNIGKNRWSGSLLFRRWQALEANAVGGEVRLRLDPESDCSASNHSQDFKWQPWLTNCVRSYYNTGTLRIPEQCNGSDILLALEFFGIVYSPDQLVFDTFAAYLRVKLWSDYFTHRCTMADWVVRQLLRLPSRHSQTFCTSPDVNDGAIFVLSKRVEIFDGGLPLDANRYGDLPSRAVVHDFFNDDERETQEDYNHVKMVSLMRNDFCSYLYSFLPGTNVTFQVSEVNVFLHRGVLVSRRRAVLHIDYRGPDNPSPAPSVNLAYRTAEQLTPMSSSDARTISDDEFSGVHKIMLATPSPNISRMMPSGGSPKTRSPKGSPPSTPPRGPSRENRQNTTTPKTPPKESTPEPIPNTPSSAIEAVEVEKRLEDSAPTHVKPLNTSQQLRKSRVEPPKIVANAPFDEVTNEGSPMPPLNTLLKRTPTEISDDLKTNPKAPIQHIVGREGDMSVVSAMSVSIEAKDPGQAGGHPFKAGLHKKASDNAVATPLPESSGSSLEKSMCTSESPKDFYNCSGDNTIVTATMDAFRKFLCVPAENKQSLGKDASPTSVIPDKEHVFRTVTEDDSSEDDILEEPPKVKRLTSSCEPCWNPSKETTSDEPDSKESFPDFTLEWFENTLGCPQAQDLCPSDDTNENKVTTNSIVNDYPSVDGSESLPSVPRTVKDNLMMRQEEIKMKEQQLQSPLPPRKARRTVPLKGAPALPSRKSRIPMSLPRSPREPKKPVGFRYRRETNSNGSTDKMGNLSDGSSEKNSRSLKGILLRKKNNGSFHTN